jgi:hypothetical protein
LRQAGGVNVSALGICPATVETRLDTIHGGKNAGRACWVVAGTLCQGKVQGTFAQKFQNCETCEFYLSVKKEEFPQFTFASVLLNKIR